MREQVIVAALIIALGAWLDDHATNQTRPQELYLSQALLGFGTTLFIGPALAFGFLRMLERGPASFRQPRRAVQLDFGIGVQASLLGSYQVIATRAHLSGLVSISWAPIHRSSHASGSGWRAAVPSRPVREATILAFNDVFLFVAVVALATALFLFGLVLRDLWRASSCLPEAIA